MSTTTLITTDALGELCRRAASLLEPTDLAGSSALTGGEGGRDLRELGTYRIALDLKDYAAASSDLMPENDAAGGAEAVCEFCLNVIALLLEAIRLQGTLETTTASQSILQILEVLEAAATHAAEVAEDAALQAEYFDSLSVFRRRIAVLRG